jgi:hypothetical protein
VTLKSTAFMIGGAIVVFFVGAVFFRALAARGYDPIASAANVFGPRPVLPPPAGAQEGGAL